VAYLNPAAGFARQGLTTAGAPVAGTDAVQTLTIGGTPTAGTFRLSFDGATTAAITWSNVNATLVAAVDAALEALATIGTGNVTTAVGTATAGIGTFTITFTGALAKKAVGAVTVAENALTGTSPTLAVATTTPGVTASGRGAPKGTQATRSDTGVALINTGTAYAPTWIAVGSQT
jgi:hypothetical protein